MLYQKSFFTQTKNSKNQVSFRKKKNISKKSNRLHYAAFLPDRFLLTDRDALFEALGTDERRLADLLLETDRFLLAERELLLGALGTDERRLADLLLEADRFTFLFFTAPTDSLRPRLALYFSFSAM